MSSGTTHEFIEATPSPSNSLRDVVLFGRNVARYEFALTRSLLELSRTGAEATTLEELAVPFHQRFPISPRAAQAAADDVARSLEEPAIVVIEAEMGAARSN
jgi:hypothetical protein